MAFTKLAVVKDIPTGVMKKFDLGELEITAANVEGGFHAFEDRCPHMYSRLHQGKLEERGVVCPFHKARFDVTTGEKTRDPRVPVPRALKMGAITGNIRTHDLIVHTIKVENGSAYIEH